MPSCRHPGCCREYKIVGAAERLKNWIFLLWFIAGLKQRKPFSFVSPSMCWFLCILPFEQSRSSVLLVIIFNPSYNDNKITKSGQFFHVICVSEINLYTVTFSISPACLDNFLLCFCGFSQARRREKFLRWQDCKVHTLDSLGASWEDAEITFYWVLFYSRLAHVFFGLLMWSMSYPKLKG